MKLDRSKLTTSDSLSESLGVDDKRSKELEYLCEGIIHDDDFETRSAEIEELLKHTKNANELLLCLWRMTGSVTRNRWLIKKVREYEALKQSLGGIFRQENPLVQPTVETKKELIS